MFSKSAKGVAMMKRNTSASVRGKHHLSRSSKLSRPSTTGASTSTTNHHNTISPLAWERRIHKREAPNSLHHSYSRILAQEKREKQFGPNHGSNHPPSIMVGDLPTAWRFPTVLVAKGYH